MEGMTERGEDAGTGRMGGWSELAERRTRGRGNAGMRERAGGEKANFSRSGWS